MAPILTSNSTQLVNQIPVALINPHTKRSKNKMAVNMQLNPGHLTTLIVRGGGMTRFLLKGCINQKKTDWSLLILYSASSSLGYFPLNSFAWIKVIIKSFNLSLQGHKYLCLIFECSKSLVYPNPDIFKQFLLLITLALNKISCQIIKRFGKIIKEDINL